MRKKLLRSRTGFEKPESREEAIMQNILGASNVLEPSESNIEEILKSILYNTPYTKEAEFEIEKILLAIKNNGTYDGEFESRDMKILIAILKDLDYTEEAESRIEELFIEWLHQRSSIKVLEGVPPLTFTARGLPLINYLIEGNTVQSGTPTPQNPIQPSECGDRTGNLFDKSTWDNVTAIRGTVDVVANGIRLTATANDAYTQTYSNAEYSYPVTAGETYTLSWDIDNLKVYGIVYLFSGSTTGNTVLSYVVATEKKATFTIPNGHQYLSFRLGVSSSGDTLTYTNFMLNSGSTPLPYEPYGYKIPIISAGQTFDVYIGAEPLRKAIDGSDVADTITYSTQQLIRRVDGNGNALATPTTETINVPELPTNNGTTVIDVDTTVKPSNIYIEYK